MNLEGQPQATQRTSLSGPISLLRQACILYIKSVRVFIFISLFSLLLPGFIFILSFLSGGFGLALLFAKGINLFSSANSILITISIFLAIIVLAVIGGLGQVAMLYAVKEEDIGILCNATSQLSPFCEL